MNIGHKYTNFNKSKGLKSTVIAKGDSFHTAQFHISCRLRYKRYNKEKKKENTFLTLPRKTK